MQLAQYDKMIHTLTQYGSNQPFSKAILPGLSWIPMARDAAAIDPIPIADEVAQRPGQRA